MWLLVAATTTVVPAADPSSCSAPPEPVAACPAVFSEALPESFELPQVRRGSHGYWITHDHDWSAPQPLETEDLAVSCTAADAAFAVVWITIPPEGCAAGPYRIAVADSLGTRVVVLSIVEHGLLLEVDGELRVLMAEGVEPPTFRMAWRAPFSIPRPPRYSPPRRPNRRNKRGRR